MFQHRMPSLQPEQDDRLSDHGNWADLLSEKYHDLQALGHHPRIGRRIARKVYDVDADLWSRNARLARV